MILSAVPAVMNLKPLSWEAAGPGALNAKVKSCKNRCLFSRTGAVVNPPHQEVQAAVLVVPAVPAPIAVLAVNHKQSIFNCQL